MKLKIFFFSISLLMVFFVFADGSKAADCDALYDDYSTCMDSDNANCEEIYNQYNACTEVDSGDYEQQEYDCPTGWKSDPNDPTMCIEVDTVYTYSQCKEDGGDDTYCGQFSGAPVTAKNLSDMSDGQCNKNMDCGTGFTCYNSSCVDYGTYKDNTAWYDRAWEGATDFFTGDRQTLESAGNSLLRLNNSANIPGIGNVPAGSTITDNGLIISPDGRELGIVSDSQLDTMVMQGNSGTGGYLLTSGAGFPGTTGGVGGRVSAKCGAGFEEIGGVCFPSKSTTGLSDAPILNIVMNLYVWLMMLFGTLAVGTFVYSGILYVTAAGDSGQITTAKNNAKWAVTGIIVALSGFVVLKAIEAALSGQTFMF